MAYSAAAILALASQCALSVAPETVLAIIQTESSGDPFALNVNGGRQPARQSNAADAAATARRFWEALSSAQRAKAQALGHSPPETSKSGR